MTTHLKLVSANYQRFKLCLPFLLLFSLLLVPMCNAQITVYSNYTAGSPGAGIGEEYFAVGDVGQAIASPFTPNATVNLSSVTVNLDEQFSSTPDNYVFRVYNSAGTVPGSTVLETLPSQEITTSTQGDYTFNALGTTLLTSGTKYWLVLQPQGNDRDYDLYWHLGTANPGDGRAAANVNTDASLGTWGAAAAQPFSVIVQGTAVPEPSAYAGVLGAVALAAAVIHRWKRK
jgi:hypothetical protein